ncbi:MAG: transcriptional activator [Candidatus Aramenus sulfurataquae]|uniref:Thiaminase II n=4 Tax=Candidatus Aramenus sulfurataquae TaxID=1326980 RepID=A0ACC6TQZ3_9CREN|nr:MAG: transcriptional activator [Candidatus Aramenus sulfurataquae]
MLTEEMWNSISDVYSAIMSHPFLRELVEGTLQEEKFKYYIAQDYLYLKEFSRALSVLSAKAPEDQGAVFAEHVTHVMNVERELHQYFISKLDIKTVPPSPTNLLYTSFLLSTVYSRPYHEGVSAVLPCYWIYMEVGKELKKRGSPKEEYQRWIDTYGGEEYERGVRQVLEIANSFKLADEEKKEAIKKFRLASIMEYMFWDSAYKLEGFPFSI